MAYERTVEAPDGVEMKKEGDTVTVSGPKGGTSRLLKHAAAVMSVKGNTFTVKTESKRKADRAVVGTWAGLVKNMIKGVREGYEAKLKVVYLHFPMTLSVQEKRVEIKNFLGGRGSRSAAVVGDSTTVEVSGEDVTVKGINRDEVGQTSANLERACRLTKKDRRWFSDGVYITKKA